jgi:hypothetical protein
MSLAGRPSERRRRLATGGQPRERLAAALVELGPKPGTVQIVRVAHDNACPCLSGHGMSACTCEIVDVSPSPPIASPADLREYLDEERGA